MQKDDLKEQYVYVSFGKAFQGWYRDPDEISSLGDLVIAPLRRRPTEGEVILVHRMTAEEARFFYRSRISLIISLFVPFAERRDISQSEALKKYESVQQSFQQNPERFAFRIKSVYSF